MTSPGPEDLSRRAYEAHRSASSASLPSWEDITEDERQSWRAAVSAVSGPAGPTGQTGPTGQARKAAVPAFPPTWAMRFLDRIQILPMRLTRKAKFRITGVSFPVIGGGVTWGGSVDERAVRARTERADAFTELWRVAQEAHIGVRTNFDNVDGLAAVHRQLNILLIRKGPMLDRADVELAQNFLSALGEFVRLLRPMTGLSADNVREQLDVTLADVFVPRDLDVLDEALSRMSNYNESFTRRYRELVFGETS